MVDDRLPARSGYSRSGVGAAAAMVYDKTAVYDIVDFLHCRHAGGRDGSKL
ncbi:hypothetical protein D1872_308530 [compost metagenome]